MSGVLECVGVFQVPVPDGWLVTGEPGSAYDLSHAFEDVAVNISVYQRRGNDTSVAQAARAFAVHVGADPASLHIVTTDHDDRQSRAFTRFAVGDRCWLIVFLHVTGFAVLATSVSRVGDKAAFAAGECIVSSLGPVSP